MNLIYTSLFYQESYLELLRLLITSIFERGNINNETTDIVIMTSSEFKPKIEKIVAPYNLPIKYFLFNINNVMESSMCRLNIFDYENINRYKNILYLDADILINNDVNKIFDFPIQNKLYALEEDTIGGYHFGREFFDYTVFNPNLSAFNAGVLYFKNCEEIKSLFDDTRNHIVNWFAQGNPVLTCFEQPFLVYHTFLKGLVENQVMKQFVVINPENIDDKIIYHFAGTPGQSQNKQTQMSVFINKIRAYWANTNIRETYKEFDNRNEMIVFFSKLIHRPRILEIGIFKGQFFDFIFSNCAPEILDGVDLFEGITCSGDANGNNLEYCNIEEEYNKLKEKYKTNQNVRLLKSYSVTHLVDCQDNYYDIIYIDGDHSYNGVINDLENAFKKIKPNGYIMGHDYEINSNKTSNQYMFGVKDAVTDFCNKYNQRIIAKALDGCVSFCIKVIK
jgi:lipopolysaccharide biosynthesis glycosyltransferase